MEKESRYFQEALSNFMHDAASGSAIRHLVDRGLSVDQIMQELDYPTPRSRVERTVYEYMLQTGILLWELPAEVNPDLSGSAVANNVSEFDHGSTANNVSEFDYGSAANNVSEFDYRLTEIAGVGSGNRLDEKSTVFTELSFRVIRPGRISRGELRRLLMEEIGKNGEEQSYMFCPFGQCGSSGIPEEWLRGLTGREREYLTGIPWQKGSYYHRLNGRMLEIGLQLAVTWELESRFYFLGTRQVVVYGN